MCPFLQDRLLFFFHIIVYTCIPVQQLSYSEFKNFLRTGKTPNNYTKVQEMVHLSSASNVNMKMIEIQVRKQDS